MSDDPPRRRTARKGNLATRVRDGVRGAADRILGADLAWSVSFVVVCVLVFASQRCGSLYPEYRIGDEVAEAIRAPFDLEVVDTTATERRRAEARDAVPDAYVLDLERGARLSDALEAVFAEGRAAAEAGRPATGEGIPPAMRGRALAALYAVAWAEDVERALVSSLRRNFEAPIVGNRALLTRETAILVVRVPGGEESLLEDYGEVLDLDEARTRVREDVRRTLDLGGDREVHLANLAAAFVDANLTFDPEGTRVRRERRASAVPPVLTRIDRGTVLVEADGRVDARAKAALDAVRRAAKRRFDPAYGLGLLLISAVLAFFLHRYATYHQRGFKRLRHLYALLVLVALAMLLLSAGLMWIVDQVADGLPSPLGDVGRYVPLVPVGAVGVLVALLANGRIATVHAAFVAVLFGILNGWTFHDALWALLTQWAGVFAVTGYRDRSSLLRAGLVVGSAGAVAYVGIEAVRDGFADVYGSLYGAGLAFVGGAIGAGLVVSFTLPMLESLFGVLTEIRLLELSSLDNPLLSQLALKAPGSYNHSLVVGTLAEDGAKAIGANALFCRVAAFYHDIGKMMKPEYFVENQSGGNLHDGLAPSMSALIISSHVKDGVRLAREAGVPEQIVDIIPQHHGTRLMTFFYEKAKAAADPRRDKIDERDFRYPGPKPQTREAAIFMLADAVEAAARTVDEPTPGRLSEMIRRVTNAVVLDGQFDECDLTFADLDRLQDAFLRNLTSMYHHRVDYPGFDFNRPRPVKAAAP